MVRYPEWDVAMEEPCHCPAFAAEWMNDLKPRCFVVLLGASDGHVRDDTVDEYASREASPRSVLVRAAAGMPGGMSESTMSPGTLALRELLDASREEFRELLDRFGAARPMLFVSVARGAAHAGSDVAILVEMDPADGNLLMRASGLMAETRVLFGRDDVDVFPVQLLKRPLSVSALVDAVPL